MLYPIANDCLKLSIDGQTGPQLVPNLLFQVSFRELHNSTVITPEEGGLEEEIYAEDSIKISDLNLRKILPPQLKKMTDQYKLVCGSDCCISAKIIHSSLLTWIDFHLRHLKDTIHNAQKKGLMNDQVAYLKPIKML